MTILSLIRDALTIEPHRDLNFAKERKTLAETTEANANRAA